MAMQVKTTADALGLVVPVALKALCVGKIDQEDEQGTTQFAGATTDFKNQIGTHDGFLGINVVRALTGPPLHQLTQGIHLHWALPEAFTHSNQKEGESLSFLPVCNRWLINRIITPASGSPTRQTWILESDVLAEAAPAGQLCITLPVKQLSASDPNYQYVGQNTVFSSSWAETADPLRFKNLTGSELTAVASGDATFAAFYPNCMNVFGFYDTLQDVTVPTGGTVNVTYQVTGWFSNPTNDPLNGGKSKEDVEKDYAWTFAGEDTAQPGYTLCSGLVQNIAWNPENTYVVNQPQQQPVQATAAIGNNPPEALAAFFRDKLHPEVPFFEQLLEAFQQGLLNTFKQPTPNQLAHLEEKLHQQEFRAGKAGKIYIIVQKKSQGKEQEVKNLPLKLAEALNKLNRYQQEHDAYQDYIDQFKWQLFADWYRWIQASNDEDKNNLNAVLLQKLGTDWPAIQRKRTGIRTQLEQQRADVQAMVERLGAGVELQATAAPRYWHANEPVVVLTSEADASALTPYRTTTTLEQPLVCRLTSELLGQVAVNGQAIPASQFPDVNLPQPNHLPYAAATNVLLLEGCLLNTQLLASLTSVSVEALTKALQQALNGQPQSIFTFDKQAPALLAVAWWQTNPWTLLSMEWSTQLHPMCDTNQEGKLHSYPSSFFTNLYSIGPDTGGAIDYQGTLDPGTIDFGAGQIYQGSALLSTSAAQGLKKQLTDYLAHHKDDTLQSIVEDLEQNIFQSQALSGFNASLIMQAQALQLQVKAQPDSEDQPVTDALAPVIGTHNTVAPVASSTYNPIRAGFMKLSFDLVDTYGQKRKVFLNKLVCADSLTTTFQETTEPGIVYLPPRIAQPTRLIFRWLAAIGDTLQEMNAHPATTPVCGWILPNHLNEGLFFYDQQGKALGTMFLSGDQSTIEWQSAPGDNSTINQPVEVVFKYQNPQLSALANALYKGTPGYFKAFWRAIDSTQNFINPQSAAASGSLALLIGRPVAITQAILGLELKGSPALNQSYEAIDQGDDYDTYDNEFTQVQFPVILGDLKKQDDGLVGYFKTKGSDYDFGTFYTEAADGKDAGVVKPGEANLTLTAFPKPGAADPTDNTAYLQKVLMLVDPRAQIHATTGILPTKAIDIPSDQYAAVLETLEMTFLMTPILEGASRLTMPLPKEAGYTWSWIKEVTQEAQTSWEVDPVIAPTTGQAVAGYTPQTIQEGWLRLNPDLLNFALVNASGQPVAQANTANTLTLHMTNQKGDTITLPPGQLVNEGTTQPGAIFYIHFGQLVADENVAQLSIAADNWTFKCLSDPSYGHYWAATPTQNITLADKAGIVFTISNLMAADKSGQVQLFVDYYGFKGLNDGTKAVVITLEAKS